MENEKNLDNLEVENNENEENGEGEAKEKSEAEPKRDLSPEQVLGIKKRQLTKLAKELGIEIVDPAKKPEPAENKDPGYEKLVQRSFLNSIDVKDKEDQDWIISEAQRLKLSVDEISEFDYVRERLKKSRERRNSQEALPTGSKRSAPSSRNTADYWFAKFKAGEVSFNDIPDVKIRREVRRMKEAASGDSSFGTLK